MFHHQKLTRLIYKLEYSKIFFYKRNQLATRSYRDKLDCTSDIQYKKIDTPLYRELQAIDRVFKTDLQFIGKRDENYIFYFPQQIYKVF